MNVGDEVIVGGKTKIVLTTHGGWQRGVVCGFDYRGIMHHAHAADARPTGKHYPEIVAIMQNLGGES